MEEQKPRLIVCGKGDDGLPTIEQLIAMFKAITGREPSTDDIASALAKMKQHADEELAKHS